VSTATAAGAGKTATGPQVETGGGKCSCMPLQGDFTHGNNMRLAPKFQPAECDCRGSAAICLAPVVPCAGKPNCDDSFGALCKKKKFMGHQGTPCRGFDTTGAPLEGTADCDFVSTSVDVYAGPPGRPCKGFTLGNKLVDGRVACFAR
jgi:hypothetical protein